MHCKLAAERPARPNEEVLTIVNGEVVARLVKTNIFWCYAMPCIAMLLKSC